MNNTGEPDINHKV